MRIRSREQAKWAGFAMSWCLLVQTLGTLPFLFRARSSAHFLGHNLPLSSWALCLLAWSLPLGAVAALALAASRAPRLWRSGGRGFLLGLASMVALGLGLSLLTAIVAAVCRWGGVESP